MVRSERELLSGNVEVDETLVGGVKHGGKRGRGTAKSIVVIAICWIRSSGSGRFAARISVTDMLGLPVEKRV
jgi:hypothetical protein